MRTFIAIDLPGEIRQALGQKQADFQTALVRAGQSRGNRDANARWTHPEGVHITLKFLGEISEAQVTQVTSTLSGFEPVKRFSIEVKGFGFFPGPARPRVFWAGVVAPPELGELAGRIEANMAKLGFAREQRAFNPHLTLARFREPRPCPALRSLVEQFADFSFGSFEVSEFFLFESKLSPHGAEYRKVARFPTG